MAGPNVQKLLELDLETRLALVQQLWDSIVDDAIASAQLPLAEHEYELLDKRVREDDRDPDAAIPWAEARACLRRSP
jgi:putative addiction module component (TIGR02574 family)